MDYANKLKLFVMQGWVFRGKEEKWVTRNLSLSDKYKIFRKLTA
jgi:hypothetical protein